MKGNERKLKENERKSQEITENGRTTKGNQWKMT